MITLEQATAIAEQKAIELKLGFGISHVISYDDIQPSKPSLYIADISNCWIAFIEPEPYRIGLSKIIAIDRESGLVVAHGTTNI